MIRQSWVAGCVLLYFATGVAHAHYPWLVVKSKPGTHGSVDFYFEEGPRVGDGQYLDPFLKRSTTWIRSASNTSAAKLKMSEVKEKGKRWMTAELPAGAPVAIDNFCQWGVYAYGKTNVLLHYYSRHLKLKNVEDLKTLGSAKHLKLDMELRQAGDKIEIQVTWQGKPKANCAVSINGPGGLRLKPKTDVQGKVSFKPKANGVHRLQTLVTEAGKGGTFEKKEYQEKRHHGTMILTVPLP